MSWRGKNSVIRRKNLRILRYRSLDLHFIYRSLELMNKSRHSKLFLCFKKSIRNIFCHQRLSAIHFMRDYRPSLASTQQVWVRIINENIESMFRLSNKSYRQINSGHRFWSRQVWVELIFHNDKRRQDQQFSQNELLLYHNHHQLSQHFPESDPSWWTLHYLKIRKQNY